MSTKGIADIVFCLDASQSMQPCFDGMRNHILDFVKSLELNQQMKWDWRIDFVAHSASETQGQVVLRHMSLFHEQLCDNLYNTGKQSVRCFTSDLEAFKQGLARVQAIGDEASLIALDVCLDFPWRDAVGCHRIVVMMTDEPFEQGVATDLQRARLDALIKKIQQLRVMLFIVAPHSDTFDQLAAADRSEYEVVQSAGDGLAGVNFREVLSYIGKSVSVSQQTLRAEAAPRGLFGQAGWGKTNVALTGE